MATYIHVNNQAPALLGRNRADAAANRMRADERLWMQGQAREQAAAQVQAKPVDYAHRKRLRQGPDEPSAKIIEQQQVGHFTWWAYGYRNNNYWRVYSGDCTSYVSGESQSTAIPSNAVGNSSTFAVTWIVLPIKADLCIAVMVGRRNDRYNTVPDNFNISYAINRAYVCTTKTVREISIPSPVQAVIEVLNPVYPDADYDAYEPPGVDTNPFPPRQIYYASIGWANAFITYQWTPTIYELLNYVAAYIDPSLIRQFPSQKLWLTEDFTKGAYAGDPVDKSSYYAEWLGDPNDVDINRPDLLRPRPELTLTLPSGFVYPTAPESQFDPLYGYIDISGASNSTFYVWDWDDANYCRQMLTALGFQPADLVP